MSQKKGAPKHKNKEAYKVDKWKKNDKKIVALKNMQVINCCAKCTAVIEWKIQYGKYKTLTQPAKCLDCLEKKIKYAYHTRCIPCVEKTKKCAKCGELTAQFVNDTPLTQAEQARKDAEYARDLKALPERRRRTFLRYMENLTEVSVNPDHAEDQENAKEKLASIKEKYGREDGDFDLEDLDDDLLNEMGDSDEE